MQTACGARVVATILACGLSLSLAPAVAQPPSNGLRIVVVEGEDAINIVQQKTAVAPVVEVRDRNGQPVAGAIVRFAIRGGRATFGGPNTLTLTTNAAGRAAVTALTPTGTGALQITATATFQGQTAAVTIAQTNVMSVAASGAGASGGSAASAGGAAGGGGGGISATTVAVVGGAAAGGTLVANEFLGFTTYEGDIAGDVIETVPRTPPCAHTSHWTGRLIFRLKGDSDVSGEAKVKNASNLFTSTTCPFGNVGATFPWGFSSPEIEGTTTAIRFNATDAGTGYMVNYDFLGSLNGSTVTGTLTIRTSYPGGSNFNTGSGVIPVTLQ